jgi:hypothetical protein
MDWVTKRKASKHEEGMKAWGEKWGALPIKRELQLSRVRLQPVQHALRLRPVSTRFL